MLPKLSHQEWKELHSCQFVSTPECWLSCGGGACCNMGLVRDLQFSMLPTVGTTLIYMGDELEYFRSKDSNFPLPTKTLSMELDEGDSLTIHTAHCALNGSCIDSFPKPLLCKMYPYVPVVGFDGSLERIVAGSIYDWTYEAKGWTSFCTSFSNEGFFQQEWSRLLKEVSLLSHPYIVFYSQAIKIFHEDYVACLNADERLMNLEGVSFWKSWELAYLTGKLFCMDRIRPQVRALYKQIAESNSNERAEK